MMNIVGLTESWGIYGPCIDQPALYNGPDEAMAAFILNPSSWPEDVNFWLALCCKGGREWPSLGEKIAELKRPVFHGPRLARFQSQNFEAKYTVVDFWFVGRMLEALDYNDYRFVVIREDGEPIDASVFSGGIFYLRDYVELRIKKNWAKDFLLVTNPRALNYLGVEPINAPAVKRGWIERKSHRFRSLP